MQNSTQLSTTLHNPTQLYKTLQTIAQHVKNDKTTKHFAILYTTLQQQNKIPELYTQLYNYFTMLYKTLQNLTTIAKTLQKLITTPLNKALRNFLKLE